MEVISSGEGRELTLTLRGELDHHAAKEAMRKLEEGEKSDESKTE